MTIYIPISTVLLLMFCGIGWASLTVTSSSELFTDGSSSILFSNFSFSIFSESYWFETEMNISEKKNLEISEIYQCINNISM